MEYPFPYYLEMVGALDVLLAQGGLDHSVPLLDGARLPEMNRFYRP